MDLTTCYAGLDEAEALDNRIDAMGDVTLTQAQALRLAERLAVVFRTRLADRQSSEDTTTQPPGFIVVWKRQRARDPGAFGSVPRRTGQTFVALCGNTVIIDVGVDYPLAVLKAKSPQAALEWARKFFPAASVA